MKNLFVFCSFLLLAVTPLLAMPQTPAVPSQCMTAVPSADDFLADYTGPASDIRFWYTWRGDVEAPLNSFRVAFRADDGGMPGDLLWERTVTEWQTTTRTVNCKPAYICPMQVFENDHLYCHQVDITGIADPFMLEEGQMYWLELQADVTKTPGLMPSEMIGWRLTAGVHNSPAMWYYPPPMMGSNPQWVEAQVKYPELGSLDLAFVIVPEPATISLLVVGLATMLRRRK